MSEGSASKDEQREVDDDGAIGVRTDSNPDEPIGPEEPIGDADDSPGYTMEDYERVAAKPGVPSERELLLQMLWRLGRIEEQLEKGGHQVPQSSERRSLEVMLSELIDGMRRMERNIFEIGELSGRVRRIEEAVANVRIDRRTSGQSSEPPSAVYGPTPQPQQPEPQGPMPVKAKDAPGQSSKP